MFSDTPELIEAMNVKGAEHGSLAGSNRSAGLEESPWLCPIEDRHTLDSSREGMLEGFSLGSYLMLVDYTGRLVRDGKAAISAEVTGILDRLQSSAESWRARLEKLRGGRLLGRFFAASRERLREVAARLGVHHLANRAGCPARSATDERDPFSTLEAHSSGQFPRRFMSPRSGPPPVVRSLRDPIGRLSFRMLRGQGIPSGLLSGSTKPRRRCHACPPMRLSDRGAGRSR